MNRFLLTFLTAVLLSFVPGTAGAKIERSGLWPEGETVSLTAHEMTRGAAVRALAEKAGWSLVAEDLDDKKVELEVKDQPATKVLELLLADGTYLVSRDGSLVSIRRAPAPAALAAPSKSATADGKPTKKDPSSKKGEDRMISDEATIGVDEVVHDVFVFGGKVLIEGTVTGSVVLFGGSATLTKTAYVSKDVVAFGGSLDLQNGTQVDGDVSALFGTLRRGDKVEVRCRTCQEEPKDYWTQFFDDFFEKLTGVSLFWLFGALVIAVAFGRVEIVREELLRRPLRCVGFGVLGVFGLFLILLTLVVTLIGIPLAVLGGLFAALSVYVGFCVVLLTAGSVLFRGRSKNPYVHLAVGCAAFFLIQWIPVVGGLVCALGFLAAVGALVTSRAGFFPKKEKPSGPAEDARPVAAG